MADDIGTLHTQKAADNAIGLYFVKAVVGNVGTPGAPIVNLALTVQAASGHVSGIAEINQAVVGGQHRFPVTGQIYQTGFGPNQQLVSLSGEFVYSVPPPATVVPPPGRPRYQLTVTVSPTMPVLTIVARPTACVPAAAAG